MLNAPIIDDIDLLSQKLRLQLENIASESREKKRLPPEIMESIILNVCENHFFTLSALAKLLKRNDDLLRKQYLKKSVKEHQIQLAFPSTPTHEKQAVIHAVAHDSRIDVAQAKQVGNKSSEITTVREFIKETGLESQNLTLDAHHCYPDTMSPIQEADGTYLIQVKENQPKLLEHCRNLALQSSIAEIIEHDSGHGRISSYKSDLYKLSLSDLDDRWQTSGMRFLVVVNRETIRKSNSKQTQETSYYVSNYKDLGNEDVSVELTKAIRKHGSVESNNWQLDVTFNEDNVRVSDGNQSQILSNTVLLL